MTIDDKKDLEYVDYKVKYQEAENSCLERVSPGNCFFMHFRTVAGHMVLRSLYNSGCTTIPIARSQRSPRLHFCSFLISVSGEGHSTFSGAENTDL